MTVSKTLWSIIVVSVAFTAACGTKTATNPLAPSAVIVDGQHPDESGGAISTATGKGGNGNSNGGGNDKGNGNDDKGGGNDKGNPGGGNTSGPGNGSGNGNQPSIPGAGQAPTNTTPSTTRKVEIEGVIAAKVGDAITVNGQDVSVPPTCVIRHGDTRFTFADLHTGDRVHVKGTRTTTGAGATATTKIEASEVMLQNPGDADDEGDDDSAKNFVSVTAVDSLADETGTNPGSFRLTRAGTTTLLASPLTVSFTITGTATAGSDYQAIPLTAAFAANQTTVDVAVTPIADTVTEGPESVILTLTTVPAPYEVGSPSTATVTITDTSSPLVSVTAIDSSASEIGPDLGTFRFSRTGSTAASLTVTFTVTGTATNGTDYQTVPTSITFAAGQASADLFVVPLADGVAEGVETVVVTVTDGAAYDVGTPASATVSIAG